LLHGNRLCIFDGFLLYTPSMSAIQPYLDVKFFLRVSYEKAKVRREARSGYATIEGWWADPPGYVDKIVWPNYVRDHAWMFIDGDVEGRVKPVEVKKEGINVQDMDGKYRAGEEQADMGETLSWLVGEVIRGLEELWGNSGAKHE
jgi:nicotinamide/nicotinate riboside kinase